MPENSSRTRHCNDTSCPAGTRMMKNDIRTATVVAVCAVMLGNGCATTHRQYSGEDRSRADVATITIRNSPIYTSRLNGAEPKTDKSRLWKETLLWGGALHFALNVVPKVVAVVPGDQQLEVNFCLVTGSTRAGNTITTHYLHSKHPKTLSFDARAGRAYRVNGRQEGNDWSAYVEDVTDKGSNVVCSVTDSSASFENALQKAMADGDISTDEITITYPDGSKKTIPNPGK